MVYRETQVSEHQAILRERQIKRWSRGKKEALITGDTEALKTLAERKTHPVPAKKPKSLPTVD
jgi:putative endonuclease